MRIYKYNQVAVFDKLLFVCVLFCFLLAISCSSYQGPVHVSDKSYEKPGKTFSRYKIYTVQADETLYEISEKYNVPLREIIEVNRIRPPYVLSRGQVIYLPNEKVHLVRSGDTLYSISRMYGVDMSSLARVNKFSPPYTIFVGQKLYLPYDTRNKFLQKTRENEIVATTVSTNDQIKLYGKNEDDNLSVRAFPVPKPELKMALNPPKRDNKGFIWPVDGRIVSRFGTKDSALHNDGLNIAAPIGAPVLAADNGVVAYAGNQIRGFGNLLLIKHSGGLITAYAHANKLLVGRGDLVSRGQVVARVGKTGGIDVPQLHFEIRRGSEAVDPRKFLPS